MASVLDRSRLAGRKDHWDEVYTIREETDVSWYQEAPALSLQLIREAAPGSRARVIDVGGGASVLVDRLLGLGFPRPAVLDISSAALDHARERLGSSADRVDWLVADVTRSRDLGCFDVWHDRAVFHFLTEAEDRRQYVALAERTLPPGGYLIIATFAPDGPEQCSGLPVVRYDAEALQRTVGPPFTLVRAVEETHRTPWGAPQEFVYCMFRKA